VALFQPSVDAEIVTADDLRHWRTLNVGLAGGWRHIPPGFEKVPSLIDGLCRFIAGRATRASVGMQYRNECMLVDLSLSRWFVDSTSVEPTTEFNVAVDLLGFGGSAAPAPARRCRS
jgi:hypothetical protein